MPHIQRMCPVVLTPELPDATHRGLCRRATSRPPVTAVSFRRVHASDRLRPQGCVRPIPLLATRPCAGVASVARRLGGLAVQPAYAVVHPVSGGVRRAQTTY